jgi:hypothetical protein
VRGKKGLAKVGVLDIITRAGAGLSPSIPATLNHRLEGFLGPSMASPTKEINPMKDLERRRLEMFQRVRAQGREHAALAPATSFAGEQFAALNIVLEGLETHTSAQAAGLSVARQGVSGKAAARDELMRDLEAISRTARPMAASSPGLSEQFRVPHNQSDQAVLATARAFASAALPLKAEFVKRGMPADFIEDLEADIEALQEAITRKIEGRESHVTATAAIDDLIERGMKAVQELDPIMRNIFADDAAKLAGWLSACRVERSARRNKAEAGKLNAGDSTTGSAAPPTSGV